MGTTIPYLILSLFFFARHANATQNGIVGFGISLYQDLCCQACHDSLSTLYLNCTTFPSGDDMSMDMGMDMSMEIMGTTSDECYATNIPWLQTMAYCIQQNCNADGYAASKQAKCFSTQAVAGAATPTFQDSLPATAPTVELEEDGMWLNVTSLVNANIYYATHGTLGEFARSEYIHTRYSVLLYLTVIGICLLSGLLAQARSASPSFQKHLNTSPLWSKLQQHLFLPALFSSRHLEPLPLKTGYIPSRPLSIFIFFYVVLNIILSSVSFRSFQPNTWFMSPQFELCEYVGNRTGTLSLVNMSIAILFAGRNNVLIAVTGWSQTAFLTLHRWAARVAALQAIVHSIVYTLAYFEPGYKGAAAYAAKAAEPFYWWGIIATIALSLATAFAILPLRTKFYEFFLLTHIALAILALIGSWYHLVPHFGFAYGYQVWLYICFAFWSFDRLARVLRIVYYNRLGRSAAIVEALPDCNIMQVTVFPRVAWNFGPGQHSFLYLPTLGYKFWESHPFSIAGWKRDGHSPLAASTPASLSHSAANGEKAKDATIVSSTTDLDAQPNSTSDKQQATLPHRTRTQDHPGPTIQFLIRVHAGMTSSLQRRLLSSPSGSSMELSVYTEGPYAGHRATLQPLFLTDTILCIIGGIGITNALGFVQEYTSGNLQRGESPESSGRGVIKKAKRFILAWSAREISLIEHVKQNFLIQEGHVGGIEYSFWCTGASSTVAQKLNSSNDESLIPRTTGAVTAGRMDIGSVIRSSLEIGHQTTVVVCGPGNMADEATREVVNCVKEGFRVDLVEEAFAW